jgi:hypothetical protein
MTLLNFLRSVVTKLRAGKVVRWNPEAEKYVWLYTTVIMVTRVNRVTTCTVVSMVRQ